MSDPFSSGGFDPRMFEQVPLFREMAKVMSWTGGPVNWDMAQQTALSVVTSGAPVSDRDDTEFADAVAVAEMWIDQVTTLAAAAGPARALDAQTWTRMATSAEGLGIYVEPVARGMGTALARGLPEQMQGMLGGQPGMAGALNQAIGAIGAMLYGVQVGTIAGHLAGQIFGCYDLGVPTVDPRTVGTVGTTARQFAGDYGFDETEFRYWLALREATHRRMFGGVRWLRGHVSELIEQFAAEADFDPGSMLESFGGMGFDPSNTEALQEALSGSDAFRVEPTTAQQRTLNRLQSIVSFVEGWSDVVVRAAAGDRLTALPRIEEAVRRRRVEKGPGEQFLAQLIGLDLKPADFRQGQSFCQAVIAARGHAGLDRAWQEVDHLPRSDELAEPSRWLVRMAAAELSPGEDPQGQ